MIYREAADVHWDPARHHLHSPKPREWTYLHWFQHIIGIAAVHSHDLRLTSSTAWVGVPSELRREIQDWFGTTPRKPDYVETEREAQARDSRKCNYHATQEPRLKAEARKLFFEGRYSDVVRIESQIQYPEFLTPAEQQLFVLARKRQ